MNALLKRSLTHLIAIGAMLAITFSYFSPMLGGKVLKQQDITQWRGSYEEINKYVKAHDGEQTLWTNSMFGGMPSYQIGMNYPSNKVFWLDSALRLWMPNPAGTLFLMLLCFYILMLVFGVNQWLAVVGSLAYAFSSYNFLNLQAGHETKVLAVAFAPLVLAGVRLAFKGNWLWAMVLTAAGLGLELRANHLQISYYLMLIIGCWGIAELIHAIRNKSLPTMLKGVSGALAGAVIAVGLNLTNLMLTEEYSKYTIRQQSELTKASVVKDQTGGLDLSYATQWSNGTLEPLSILIPNVMGGGGQGMIDKKGSTAKFFQKVGVPAEAVKQMPAYHGSQPFTSGPIYFSAIVCFLAIFSLFVLKGEMKWALFLISILGFFLSMGKNMPGLTEFFFNNFPLYNKFRAVTMIMVIGQICFPILAVLGLNEVISGRVDKARLIKAGKLSLYIVGGICLVFLVLPGIFLEFSSADTDNNIANQIFGNSQMPDDQKKQMTNEFITALQEDRESLTRMSALRSLVFIGLAVASLWFYIQKKLKKEYLIAAIGLFITFDLWQLDKKYLNNGEFQKKNKNAEADFQMTRADMQILQDRDSNYRVYNVTVSPFNDATTSFFHKSVGGYHGAKFRRYQELREAQFDRIEQIMKQNQQMQPDTLIAQLNMQGLMGALNMMNTRYFITQAPDNQPIAVRNNYAFGNAWFTNTICWVKNADQEIDTLDGIDLRSTAAVDERYRPVLKEFAPTADPMASTVDLKSYEPNHLIYESNASADGFVVFSEIYYDKGWKCTIDGKDAEYVRCNYVLRGMKVPAGKHKIEWIFEPETFKTGESMAMVSSILLYALLFGAIGMWVRKELALDSKPVGKKK